MKAKCKYPGRKRYSDAQAVIQTPEILHHVGEVELHSDSHSCKWNITGELTVIPLDKLKDGERYAVAVNMPDHLWTPENWDKHFNKISTFTKSK